MQSPNFTPAGNSTAEKPSESQPREEGARSQRRRPYDANNEGYRPYRGRGNYRGRGDGPRGGYNNYRSERPGSKQFAASGYDENENGEQPESSDQIYHRRPDRGSRGAYRGFRARGNSEWRGGRGYRGGRGGYQRTWEEAKIEDPQDDVIEVELNDEQMEVFKRFVEYAKTHL